MANKLTKRIIKFIKWITILLVLLFGIAIALPFIFEDEVKAVALEQINKHVKANIKVEEIDLSFIKRFPQASLQFKNVSIDQAEGFGDSLVLLSAKNILIKFSLKDIIQKNYAFEKIEFVDLFFNPIINSKGEVNYDIFKSNEEQDSSSLFIDLKHIQISNSRLVFINQLTKQNVDLQIENCIAKASFGKEEINFGVNTELLFKEWAEDGVWLMQNKHVNASISADYNFTTEKLTIASSELSYETLDLLLSGSITPQEEGSELDLNITLAQANIEDIIQELPKEQRTQFDAYQLSGRLITNATISGIVDKKNLPKVALSFNLDGGKISIPDQNIALSNVHLQGNYTNGKKQSVASSRISLEDFSFDTDAGFFKGNLQVDNLKNPVVFIKANSDLELNAISSLFPTEAIKEIDGAVQLNIDSKISIQNWQNDELRTFDIDRLKGDATLQNVSLLLSSDQRTYENINGNIQFGKDKIRIDALQLDVNKQSLQLKGSIHHLMALVNPLSSDKLLVKCQLKADELDLDALLEDGTESEYTGNLPDEYDVFVDFDIQKFIWNPYIATNATGQLSLLDGDLEINPLRFNALQGSFDGQLTYLCSDKDINFLQTKGKVKNMNVSKIFTTFNNFDQEVLQAENIKGKISADIDMHIYETKKGEWLDESLSCNAHVVIEDGELIDVQELNALKSYTRIDDFSHIVFSKLENDIQINKSQILIPEMAIQSDKMTIDVYGKHSFDNAYEYHFKIKLDEVLARDVSEKQWTEFGEVQNDTGGSRTIFLIMTGQGEDFEVTYDRTQATDKLKDDLKEEGKEIKTALKTEFGPKDTPKSRERQEKRRKKKEEKELLKQQEEGKTIIEWDDF